MASKSGQVILLVRVASLERSCRSDSANWLPWVGDSASDEQAVIKVRVRFLSPERFLTRYQHVLLTKRTVNKLYDIIEHVS